MKKAKIEQASSAQEEMLPEYDFTGKEGVRGKYHRDYQQGHTARIEQPDGTVTVQHFTLEEGAVMLDPDVRRYFPDSESVNNALRSLMALIPDKSNKRKARSS